MAPKGFASNRFFWLDDNENIEIVFYVTTSVFLHCNVICGKLLHWTAVVVLVSAGY